MPDLSSVMFCLCSAVFCGVVGARLGLDPIPPYVTSVVAFFFGRWCKRNLS